MRLTELDPRWFTMDDNSDIVGVTFVCPCCASRSGYRPRLGVLFREEIDRDRLPNTAHWCRPGEKWHREGETFETLTLSPSIDASSDGHWHGFVRNGAIC